MKSTYTDGSAYSLKCITWGKHRVYRTHAKTSHSRSLTEWLLLGPIEPVLTITWQSARAYFVYRRPYRHVNTVVGTTTTTSQHVSRPCYQSLPGMSDVAYSIGALVKFWLLLLTTRRVVRLSGWDCQAYRGVVSSRHLADEVGVEINLISFKSQPSPLLLNRWNNIALVAPAQVSSRSLSTPLYGHVLSVFPPLGLGLAHLRDISQQMTSAKKQKSSIVSYVKGMIILLLYVTE